MKNANGHSNYHECKMTFYLLSVSKYHDLLGTIYSDDFGVAVGLTGMVDEACLVA